MNNELLILLFIRGSNDSDNIRFKQYNIETNVNSLY